MMTLTPAEFGTHRAVANYPKVETLIADHVAAHPRQRLAVFGFTRGNGAATGERGAFHIGEVVATDHSGDGLTSLRVTFADGERIWAAPYATAYVVADQPPPLAPVAPELRVAVAVVDWHSDTGESPDVFLALTEDAARLAAMRCVAHYAGQVRAMDDHEAAWYVEENPAPSEDADPETVAAWYEGWHDATTDGWITVTTEDVHPG